MARRRSRSCRLSVLQGEREGLLREKKELESELSETTDRQGVELDDGRAAFATLQKEKEGL